MLKNEESPLAAFAQTQERIRLLLSRLSTHCNNHFGVMPEDVSWANVDGLSYCEAQLQQLSDHLFNEGEFAKD